MKTNRINFTLKDYESKKYKVVTRVGKRVRIVCTDMKSCQPIIAIVKEKEDVELYSSFSPNGELNEDGKKNDYDLFLEEVTFENGDIVAFGHNGIGIFEKIINNYTHTNYVTYVGETLYCITGHWSNDNIRLATEEEKQRLFDALKKDGKCWNAEKKRIEDIKDECKLKPFDRVLVRDYDEEEWGINLFSHYASFNSYRFICSGNEGFNQCISFDGNEELLGTTNKKK